MGVLDDLARLTETADEVPPRDGRELFRTVRRRRTRRRVVGGATVATVAVALVAVVAWPGGDLSDRVVIEDIAGSDGQISRALPVPERGTASAGYLDDGTPVFISHDEDGTVRVLDALDPHLDSKLIVYCPQVDRFLEPRADSTYLLDGTWTGGGPSPADLSRYPVELTGDRSRVVVTGEVEPADGRSAEQRDFTGIRCEGAVAHEPDTSEPELALHDAVPADGTWGWAYVREAFEDRSLVLCHALRGCADEQDRLQTNEQFGSAADPADYTPSTLHWALVRQGSEGVDVRYAVRDIEINTGPRTELEQLRFSIGWSSRPLIQATGESGEVVDATQRLWLRFDPDGWFSADLPCTVRYGRYELLPGDMIRFDDVSSTADRRCETEQLQDVLETVLDDGERTLRVAGNDLHVATPDGHRLDYSWE